MIRERGERERERERDRERERGGGGLNEGKGRERRCVTGLPSQRVKDVGRGYRSCMCLAALHPVIQQALKQL